MSTIILNVIIILGIIIAGGFLIFFVGDLLLSIIDPKSDEKKIKAKRKKDVADFNEKLKALDPQDAEEIKKDKKVAEILALAEEDTKEEKVVDKQTGVVVESYVEKQDVIETENSEKSTEKVEEDEDQEKRLEEARAALERRKAEILKRMQEADDDEEEPELEEIEAIAIPEEKEEENEIEAETETDDETSEEDKLAFERKSLEEERARYQALIKELQEKQNQLEQAVATPVAVEEKPLAGKEEYLSRLEEKEKALESNEKELRACKKEYKPLYKVKKTLEKDEKKLRIKEAQVAKQKVMLYGVNNYADIDEEKAKKLAEELDLLDGLKLSVQHCREVMENNKDRLPVLEKMYKVLESQNEEIKNDIEYLKNMISKFED